MPWELEIHHLDLEGPGDATLIIVKGPKPRTVLVDCGPKKGERGREIVNGYLDKLKIERVDVIVVTHFDDDHVNGITELLKQEVARYRNAILYDQGEPPASFRGKESKKRDREGKPILDSEGNPIRVPNYLDKYETAVRNAAGRIDAKGIEGVTRATKLVNSFDVVWYDGNNEAIRPRGEVVRNGIKYLDPAWLLGKDVMWGNGGDERDGRQGWKEERPEGAPSMVCIAANKYVSQAGGSPRYVSNVNIFDGSRAEDWRITQWENEPGLETNAKSLGFVIRFNNFRYYIAGDLESYQEDGCDNRNMNPPSFQDGVRSYLNNQNDMEGRVLVVKASHHGSSTSTSRTFVNSLRPSVAIISCASKNRHKHPNQPTVNVLDGYEREPINADSTGGTGQAVKWQHPSTPPPSPVRPVRYYLTGYYRRDNRNYPLSDSENTWLAAGNPVIRIPGHISLQVTEEESKRSPLGQTYQNILATAGTVVDRTGATSSSSSAADLKAIADAGSIYGPAGGVAVALRGAKTKTEALRMAEGALRATAYVGNDIAGQSVVAAAAKAAEDGKPLDSIIAAAKALIVTSKDAVTGRIDIARAEAAGKGVADAIAAAVTTGNAADIESAIKTAWTENDDYKDVASKAAGLAAQSVRTFKQENGTEMPLYVAGYVAAAAIGAATKNATVAQAAVIAVALGAYINAVTVRDAARLTTHVALNAGLSPGQSALAGAVAAASYRRDLVEDAEAATSAALDAAGFPGADAAGSAARVAATIPLPKLFTVSLDLATTDSAGKAAVEPKVITING